MREIVVISGKGGTGKTSIVAAIAALAGEVVTADCDVDAADLHLLLDPKVLRKETFSGGKRASIDPVLCTGCGKCEELCRFGAVFRTSNPGGGQSGVSSDGPRTGVEVSGHAEYSIDGIACEGCGVCAYFCPAGAIAFEEVENGVWYISQTRYGPMVHAHLNAGEENSGKLVTVVRNHAKRIADERGIDTVLIDGSPGIGCPVIASITGADLVLAVTEPTMSGVHDLERVVRLTQHFGIEAMVAVNKADINSDITASIEEFVRREGLTLAGRIRYDGAVTEAQIRGRSIVEVSDGPTTRDVKRIWNQMRFYIEQEER